MKRVLVVFCIILFLINLVNAYAYDFNIPFDFWQNSDMGAGGWYNGVEAGIDGTIICTSDLSGAYVSYDRGKSWECIGSKRGLYSTHCAGMGFDPEDANVIFLGAAGGIYRSDDKAKSFEKVESGFCTDIAISSKNHNVGYASVSSGHNVADSKVYKTYDNGKTWEELNSNLPVENIMIQEFYINPENENELYAHSFAGRFCDSFDSKLFKSLDGGLNWVELSNEFLTGNILDFGVDTNNFDTLYVSGSNIGIAKSTDGGKNFEVCYKGGYGSIHIKRDNPNVVRVIGSWQRYVSEDGGKNWSVNNIDGSQFYPGAFYYGVSDTRKCDDLSDPDTIFFKNVAWLWKSSDGGETVEQMWTDEVEEGWYKSRGIKNTNCNKVVINKKNSNILFASFADMGLWRSVDHGVSWQSCNNTNITGWPATGKDTTQSVGGTCTSVLTDAERENVVWAAFSNNLYKNTNYGYFEDWKKCEGFSGEERIKCICIDESTDYNNRIIYAVCGSSLYKSEDDGKSFDVILENIDSVSSITFDCNMENLYLAGESGVYIFKDNTLEKISSDEIASVGQLACHPNDKNIIYAASCGAQKGLYKTKDCGKSWEKILEDNYLRGISIHPKNPDIMYASSSYAEGSGGYSINSNGVMVTYDGGRNWIKVNENLAWDNVASVAIDPNDTSYVFAATKGLGLQMRRFLLSSSECIIYNCDTNYECNTFEEISNCNKAGIFVPDSMLEDEFENEGLIVCVYNENTLKNIFFADLTQEETGIKGEFLIDSDVVGDEYRFFIWKESMKPIFYHRIFK